MTLFTEVQPTLENYWRSIILFGRNVASYKFALGQSLLELSQRGKEIITLDLKQAKVVVQFSRICGQVAARTLSSPAWSGRV